MAADDFADQLRRRIDARIYEPGQVMTDARRSLVRLFVCLFGLGGWEVGGGWGWLGEVVGRWGGVGCEELELGERYCVVSLFLRVLTGVCITWLVKTPANHQGRRAGGRLHATRPLKNGGALELQSLGSKVYIL